MKYLTTLRNNHRAFKRRSKSAELMKDEEQEKMNKSRAFLELVDYIENSVENGTLFLYFRSFTFFV